MNDTSLDARIAEAIIDRGSQDYTVRSGSILTLLTELAQEGNLDGMSRAYLAYVTVFPEDANRIAGAVPAKVLNQYL